jgi:periplasmic protein TonB
MGYETETDPSKRLLGLGLAVLFHILLIYGLMSGLGRELVQKVQKTVNVSIIEPAKPPPPPPPEVLEEQPEPNPKQEVKRPKAFVPKVETTVKASTVPEEAAITSTSVAAAEATPMVREAPAQAPAPPAPAPAAPKVTSPRLTPGCAQPRYPARSLEKGEEGLVIFRFLIDLDGSVKNSILVQSSGFDRLDEAAKQAFQKCKFTPGMLDGSPRQAWVRQPFRWRLQ